MTDNNRFALALIVILVFLVLLWPRDSGQRAAVRPVRPALSVWNRQEVAS